MPQIRPPRLYRSRLGVFYFRIKKAARDQRFSLRTKCPDTATLLALELNAALERERIMKNPKASDILANLDAGKRRKYELEIGGAKIRADGPEDHARAMEALREMGKLPPGVNIYPTQPGTAPAIFKSKPLAEVAELWLAECRKKNAERTAYTKERHMADFRKRIASDVEVNAITKATIVGYKTALNTDKQKANTIDFKLLSLSDFFTFAINNGHYTTSNANPVSGLFIQTKTKRKGGGDDDGPAFEEFTPDDLTRFFEPTAYKAAMNSPDFFWAPLIGIHTGSRISGVCAIQIDDILTAPSGVHYIHFRKNKNNASVRNVPIAQTLLELGFLDYVNEVRAIKAQYLFPHRSAIKGTRSKRLSERMTEYLVQQGIRRASDDGIPKSFHSFRVNVITALANANVNTIMAMRIVGHETGQGGNVQTHAGYVRDLPDLKREVDKLQWPINVDALRYRGEFAEFLNARIWDRRKKRLAGSSR